MARAKPKRTRRVIVTKILRHYRKETKLQSEVEIKVKPALLHYYDGLPSYRKFYDLFHLFDIIPLVTNGRMDGRNTLYMA